MAVKCVQSRGLLNQYIAAVAADKKAEEVTKAARVAARIKKRKLEDMEKEEEWYGTGINAVV
ncbi:hypothetical protein J6590_013682 [Homalodisca vitripennis]|nr:hypothetical protein J6590_013682 [Homalodisca vitripennis]